MSSLTITPRRAVLTIQVVSGPKLTLHRQSRPQITLAAVGVQGPPGVAGGAEWPDLPSPDLVFDNLLL